MFTLVLIGYFFAANVPGQHGSHANPLSTEQAEDSNEAADSDCSAVGLGAGHEPNVGCVPEPAEGLGTKYSTGSAQGHQSQSLRTIADAEMAMAQDMERGPTPCKILDIQLSPDNNVMLDEQHQAEQDICKQEGTPMTVSSPSMQSNDVSLTTLQPVPAYTMTSIQNPAHSTGVHINEVGVPSWRSAQAVADISVFATLSTEAHQQLFSSSSSCTDLLGKAGEAVEASNSEVINIATYSNEVLHHASARRSDHDMFVVNHGDKELQKLLWPHRFGDTVLSTVGEPDTCKYTYIHNE